MIGERARARLALPDQTSAVLQADSTAEVLRADYERWSRWLLGLVAYVLAVAGSFIGVGVGVSMTAPGVRATGFDIVMVVIMLAIAGVGVWMLVRLWHSGRQLTRAAAAWMRRLHAGGGPGAPGDGCSRGRRTSSRRSSRGSSR